MGTVQLGSWVSCSCLLWCSKS